MAVKKVVKFRRIHFQLFKTVHQISESMNKFVVLAQCCGQAGTDSFLIDLEHEEEECQSANQDQKCGDRKVKNDKASPAQKDQGRKSADYSTCRAGNGHRMHRNHIIGWGSPNMLNRSQIRVPTFMDDS